MPGKAVRGVVCETGAGAEVQLVDVGTVPGEYEESVVTDSLNMQLCQVSIFPLFSRHLFKYQKLSAKLHSWLV